MKNARKGKKQKKWIYRAAVVTIVVLFAGIFSILWNSDNSTMHKLEQDTKSRDEQRGETNTSIENKERTQKNLLTGKKQTGNYEVKCLHNVTYPKEDDLLQGKNREPDRSYLKSLKPFYQQTMLYTLLNDKKENAVYSPVNLYLCMAMLSEMADGQTRQQLLNALGQESVTSVRKQSKRIWNSIYSDSRASKCVLANSVWLRDDLPYNKNILKTLSGCYYASVYHGQMGTDAMDKAIQKWINSKTSNILKEQAENVETHEDTTAMLLSTADFYDQWSTRFLKKDTKQDTFHNADGKSVTCDFMKQTLNALIYHEKRFSSVSLDFESGRTMHIFLPDEDVTIEEMMQKDMKKILHISSDTDGEEAEYGEIAFSLPKFQITTGRLDFVPVMKNMGVTDLFHAEKGDFRKLLGEKGANMHPMYADKVEQATKVAVDEDGCCVASYTEVELRMGAAMPDKKYTVNCNRPFLFVISDRFDGVPVFAGVVYEM